MTGTTSNGTTPPRVAVITGAAQGIGAAIALRLARDGFDLTLADLPNDKAQAKLTEVAAQAGQERAGARVVVTACDVAEKDQVDALVARAVEELGRVDVMVANAGIAPVSPLLDVDVDTLDKLYAVNVRGMLLCYQAGARQMIAQGGGGRLIAACSIAGWQGYCHFGAYSATKFAVRSLNQTAAKEWGKYGITCNVYCPSPVDTQMWSDIDAGISQKEGIPVGSVTAGRLAVTPMGRLVKPEDVANVVSFLAGPDSSFVSGESLLVTGADAVA